MKRITKIILKRVVDPDPDLSWLKTEMQDGRILNSCRYSGKDIAKYGPDQVRKWIAADHRRLAEFGDTWHMIGIFAEARIQTSDDGKTWLANTVRSGGMWGIESDSDESYLKEVDAEEIAALRHALAELGFSANEIGTALGQRGPAKTRVIVTVRGGVVQAVHSTDPSLDIDVLDWDNAAEDEEAAARAKELAKDAEGMSEVL